MERRDFLAAGLALPGALRAVTDAPAPDPRAPSSSPAAPAVHTTRYDDRFEEMARVVETTMKEVQVPAAALGVIKDGQIQLRALGVTSVEDPRPVTNDTMFELASLSKTFNASAAMLLVQQGKLDLDAPVRTVLPRFRVEDEQASASLTLRNLLSQTAGFEARYNVEEGTNALGRWVPTMGDMIQLAPPGRVWSYANPAAGLAGHMIEVVTGKEIRDAYKDLIFGPIGLDRATTHITELITWPLTIGHRPGRDGKPVVVRPYSMGSSIPAGGVNMSLANLMKYIAFHLGEHDGNGQGLSRATRAAMRKPQIRKEPTGEEMGLGFHLRTLNGVQTAAHGGSAGAGHRCHLQFVPERRFGFAVLTNHTEGWRVRQAVEPKLLQAYEGLALAPNQPIIGYRGHTETLDHVTPLAQQPPTAEYVGRYRQTRTGTVEVRAAPSGGLLVGGDEGGATEIRFYGPDLAVSVGGREPGISYTFVRDHGRVQWIRNAGQIARKEA